MSRQPSHRQMEVLAEFFEQHEQVAFGFPRTLKGRATMKARWQAAAEKLNAVPDGTVKDWRTWNKYWTDKKSNLKARMHRLRQQGCSPEDGLPDIDLRIMRFVRDRKDEEQYYASATSTVSVPPPIQELTEPKDEETPEVEMTEEPEAEELERVEWGEEAASPAAPSPSRDGSASGEEGGSYAWLRHLERKRLALETKRADVERQRLELERRRLRAQERSSARVVSAVRDLDATFARIADALCALADRLPT